MKNSSVLLNFSRDAIKIKVVRCDTVPQVFKKKKKREPYHSGYILYQRHFSVTLAFLRRTTFECAEAQYCFCEYKWELYLCCSVLRISGTRCIN